MAPDHDKAVTVAPVSRCTMPRCFHGGVHRLRYGRYRARIWDPRRGALVCLGSFGAAEEAARAFDAAAVRLHGAARAVTYFRQLSADGGHGHVSCVDKDATADSSGQDDAGSAKKKTEDAEACAPVWAVKKKRKAAALPRPEAWTEFRGVHRRASGRYGAQIRGSQGEDRTWLGTFDNAEDAARAYDAAAVELHGATALTNFKHPPVAMATAEDAARAYDAAAVELHGATALTNFKHPPVAMATAPDEQGEDTEETPVDLSDFPELLALDFSSDSVMPWLDDLFTDSPQQELQPADVLLQEMEFADVPA